MTDEDERDAAEPFTAEEERTAELILDARDEEDAALRVDDEEPEYLDDEHDEDDDATVDDEEWQEGQCDNCTGGQVSTPLGALYCACAIGQGADAEDCRCGTGGERG